MNTTIQIGDNVTMTQAALQAKLDGYKHRTRGIVVVMRNAINHPNQIMVLRHGMGQAERWDISFWKLSNKI